jgi:16S rRNA (cytidine1402-2'-O)-methyltransferase
MLAGRSVALVSDAGTPGIADPGYRLVQAAIAAGLRVVPIPGPSALTAFLPVSGLPIDRFAFEGFLPARAAERRRRLQALAAEPRTLVFYETGPRLVASLADMAAAFGSRAAAIGRELTKLHEEIVRDDLVALAARADTLVAKGELVVGVAGAPSPEPAEVRADDAELVAEIRRRWRGCERARRRRRPRRERGLNRRAIAWRDARARVSRSVVRRFGDHVRMAPPPAAWWRRCEWRYSRCSARPTPSTGTTSASITPRSGDQASPSASPRTTSGRCRRDPARNAAGAGARHVRRSVGTSLASWRPSSASPSAPC